MMLKEALSHCPNDLPKRLCNRHGMQLCTKKTRCKVVLSGIDSVSALVVLPVVLLADENGEITIEKFDQHWGRYHPHRSRKSRLVLEWKQDDKEPFQNKCYHRRNKKSAVDFRAQVYEWVQAKTCSQVLSSSFFPF